MYNLTHSLLIGFGGGTFAPLLFGKPSGLLSSGDFVCFCSFISYYIIFHLPFGYDIFSFLPIKIWTTLSSQLFKAGGICSYTTIATGLFKETKYYPIPIMGPILAATLLGCVFATSERASTRLGIWNSEFSKSKPYYHTQFAHFMLTRRLRFASLGVRSSQECWTDF